MSIPPSLHLPQTNHAGKAQRPIFGTIAFVDANIDHYDHLVQGIASDTAVIKIPSDQDGVRYITSYLKENQEKYRIYIVAHGEPGALFLGSTTLSLDTLDRYSWDIQGWFSPRAYLTSSALVLYSCNVAKGREGASFLRQLRQLCGVAIAASSTPIGDPDKGGNWDLDQRTDRTNVVVPFRPRTMETYPGVLGTIEGRVWDDANENGIQDEGEGAIAGLQVTLTEMGPGWMTTTTTAQDGTYSFSGLPQGEYEIHFGNNQPYQNYDWPTPYFTDVEQGNDKTLDSDADQYGVAIVTLDNNLQTLSSVDAGLLFPDSIGGRVWSDLNFNGVRDGNEPGLGGVLVALNGPYDTLFTTTDESGSYEFSSIWPQDYYQVTIDPDLSDPYVVGNTDCFTLQNAGDNDQRDSDVDDNGSLDIWQAQPGEAIAPIDAGMIALPTIQGRVWDDLDGDGLQGDNEPGVGGVIVTLTDNYGDLVTTTTSDGFYAFENVEFGSAQIQVGPASDPNDPNNPNQSGGSSFSYSYFNDPENENYDSDVDEMGQAYLWLSPDDEFYPDDGNFTIDAGLISPLPTEAEAGAISGYLWQDNNNDGIYDDTEAPQAGTVIRLSQWGTTVVEAITNAEGFYQFTGLDAGEYEVWINPEQLDPNVEISRPQEPGSPESAFYYDDRVSVDLFQTNEVTDLNAGILLPPSISGRVWHDANGNGIQDEWEESLSGVLVELSGWSQSTQSTQHYRMLTNASGEYAFRDLEWVDYDISIQPNATLSEVQLTRTDASVYADNGEVPDESRDSDFDQYSGATSIDLHPGFSFLNGAEVQTSNLTLDAGILLPSQINGRVWHDLNHNGLQESHEPGIAGVPVALFDGDIENDLIIYTNADGEYEFRNLEPGPYELFVLAHWNFPSAQFTQSDAAMDGSPEQSLVDGALESSFDSDMVNYSLNPYLQPGQQLNIDTGIVGYLGPVYPDFYFELPAQGIEGEVVSPQFDTKNQEQFVTYSIDWGDNSKPTTVLEQDALFDGGGNIAWPEHIYEQGGSYTVTVTAIDEQGDTITQTQHIYVEGIVPDFQFSLPPIQSEDTPVALSLTPASEAAPSDIIFTVDWGDGTDVMEIGSDQVASLSDHIYESGGLYTVKVTATDKDGEQVSYSQAIQITPEFPEFYFDLPALGSLDQPVQASLDPDYSIDDVTYTIDWGNGTTQSFSRDEQPEPYSYQDDGYYTVTLTATDGDGDTVTDSRNILIGATLPEFQQKDTVIRPTFEMGVMPGQWTEGMSVPFYITPTSEEVATYQIDWGDNSEPQMVSS
ncbi:MAG: SdrD B-like domain-containing protein, partial [Cyanobacteria bacterium P01_F01_bin.150]